MFTGLCLISVTINSWLIMSPFDRCIVPLHRMKLALIVIICYLKRHSHCFELDLVLDGKDDKTTYSVISFQSLKSILLLHFKILLSFFYLQLHSLVVVHFHPIFGDAFDRQNVILRHPSLALALKILASFSMCAYHFQRHQTVIQRKRIWILYLFVWKSTNCVFKIDWNGWTWFYHLVEVDWVRTTPSKFMAESF